MDKSSSEAPDSTESIRYKRLKQISSRSLEESVKYLTVDRLASCYPTIASTTRGSEALKQARSQIANYWHTSATKEFEAVFEERDIQQKMMELDEIISMAKSRQEASTKGSVKSTDEPVHLDQLEANQVVDAHLRQYQQAEINKLEQQLEQIKAENEELLKRIHDESSQIDETASSIRASLTELDSASEAAENLPSRSQITDLVQKIDL